MEFGKFHGSSCSAFTFFTFFKKKVFLYECKCGTRTFFQYQDIHLAIFRISSAFDPKTEDLRETCKNSTKAEVLQSLYFFLF